MRKAFFVYLKTSILLLSSLVISPLLHAQTYSASFNESAWSAKTGAFACSLSHTIPAYGTAQFVRKTGGGEYLELKPSGAVVLSGTVKIEAAPPVWRIEGVATPLGQVQIAQGQAVRVQAAQVKTISSTLAQGNNVFFAAEQTNSTENGLRVALTAHNFSPAFERYRKCLAELIPYTFAQIERTLINYAPEAEELSASAKSQLDKIVRYSKADPGVIGILVDAHSEKLATPEAGIAASQQQADLVTTYLVEKGIAAGMITTRSHGDKFPIANNQNKAGQAKNRRVTVRMENEATRKAMEKKIAAIIAAEEKAAEEKAAKEKAAADQAAAEQTSSAPAGLPASLQELEQMVEQQDLTSGKQPSSPSSAK